MNPIAKEKWVAALRSGEYRQARSVMVDDTEGLAYCCLGVLCDVWAKETGNEFPFNPQHRGNCETCVLPRGVAEWAQVNPVNPNVKIGGRLRALAGMNDGGEPFTVIADAIERGEVNPIGVTLDE